MVKFKNKILLDLFIKCYFKRAKIRKKLQTESRLPSLPPIFGALPSQTAVAAATAAMDRLKPRNPSCRPHSTSQRPPRPPRGPTFHPPPTSRPLPESSSPGLTQLPRFAHRVSVLESFLDVLYWKSSSIGSMEKLRASC
jgi:hypothetical protein